MNRVSDDEFARGEIGEGEPAWDDRSGTFDPVEAGAALAGLQAAPDGTSGASYDEADGHDAVAEYMERETAYVDAAPDR